VGYCPHVRFASLAAAALAALVLAIPAAAKTPPPSVVANVGIQLAKFGLSVSGVDGATSKCKSVACLHKSYAALYAQGHSVDNALQKLWTASGQAGSCASAAADAGAGMDSLMKNFHSLENATVKNNVSAATAAAAQIRTKTPRITAVINSFKTKCR
jgi:hypothetical protein